MPAELIIAPEAEQDLAEAYGWYEARRIGLGEEFVSSVEACIEAYFTPPAIPTNSVSVVLERVRAAA
jgi:plasmid stabilization system protein ParE